MAHRNQSVRDYAPALSLGEKRDWRKTAYFRVTDSSGGVAHMTSRKSEVTKSY